MKWYQSKRS